MTEMVSRPNWLRAHRDPIPPSPIPRAAEETRQIAEQTARIADELARMNNTWEARLDERGK